MQGVEAYCGAGIGYVRLFLCVDSRGVWLGDGFCLNSRGVGFGDGFFRLNGGDGAEE